MTRTIVALSAAISMTLTAVSCLPVTKTAPVKQDITVKVLSTSDTEAGVNASVYVGSIEPSKSTTLSTSNPGTLTTLSVKVGSRVVKGQEIARVESQSIQSSYDMACNRLKQAEDGYERLMKVYATGSVPEVKKVEVETSLANAKAAKMAAEKALWHTRLVAPFDGVVSEVYCDKGVELGFAAPVVKIVDFSKVEITFPVPENEYASIPVGTAVTFEVPATEYKSSAKIASRAAIASPLSHSYEYRLEALKNSGELMPGMICKVHISKESSGNATVIPAGAVQTDMEGRYVWTVADSTVCKRHISVGGYSGDGIVVTEGLEAGDRVIVEGWRKVSTGMKVKVSEQ